MYPHVYVFHALLAAIIHTLVMMHMQVLFSRYRGQVCQGLIGNGQDPAYWLNGVTDTELRLSWCDVSCMDAAVKLAKEAQLSN